MKPTYQLLLMLIVSWISVIILDLVFEKRVTVLVFSFGQALVPFSFSAFVVIIGYILHWMKKPSWPLIMKTAWILLLLLIFFTFYARTSIG
jgi:hypothetical protein